MSTARLTALAVNTPEMKRLWVGEGEREREKERERRVPFRRWSSPASRARDTRLLCIETCSNLPEPAHSSVGLEKCPLRRWPEGNRTPQKTLVEVACDSVWMNALPKNMLFKIKKTDKSDIKEKYNSAYIKSDSYKVF